MSAIQLVGNVVCMFAGIVIGVCAYWAFNARQGRESSKGEMK